MNDEERRRFESIFQTYDVAWRQFNLRREIELKFSLTLWTALAAGIAGSLTVKDFPQVPGAPWTLFVFAAVIVGLHLMWCMGINRAQNVDQSIALDYEKCLRNISNSEFSDQTKNYLGKLKESPLKAPFWSYGFRLGVTILLVIVLGSIICNRICEPSLEHVRAIEIQKLELETEKLQVEKQKLESETEKLRSEILVLKRSIEDQSESEAEDSTLSSK
ncbi:hypothetical protein KJ758_02100 [Patescibacteria group bacterium]|nr:hypothetical protein [Patescibacteria group bacterium]